LHKLWCTVWSNYFKTCPSLWFSWSNQDKMLSLIQTLNFSLELWEIFKNCFYFAQYYAHYQIHHSPNGLQCYHESSCQLQLSPFLLPTMKKNRTLELTVFNTMIYKQFSLKKDVVSKGICSTTECVVKMWLMLQTLNTFKKIGLAEKTLILILMVECFQILVLI
jgi:hypothetical protein